MCIWCILYFYLFHFIFEPFTAMFRQERKKRLERPWRDLWIGSDSQQTVNSDPIVGANTH